jgi:1-phosphofructokinase family hexose kinase
MTLNPALDRRVVIEYWARGKTQRCVETRETPGGKGLNVAMAAKTLGADVRLMGFAGGHRGKLLEAAVRETGIRAKWLWVPEETRISTFVHEKKGNVVTEFLEPGPHVPEKSAQELIDVVASSPKSAKVACLSGGLPPGLGNEYYARLIRAWQERGVFTLLDTSGPPLRQALRANPDLVKLNREEAQAATQMDIRTQAEALAALQKVVKIGARAAVISLGGRGALVWWKGRCGVLTLPKVLAKNPVGAGDCMVAGIATAIANRENDDDIFLAGAAAGTAKAICEETGRLRIEDFRQLRSNVRLRWL